LFDFKKLHRLEHGKKKGNAPIRIVLRPVTPVLEPFEAKAERKGMTPDIFAPPFHEVETRR
jgi:hypothetical protein